MNYLPFEDFYINSQLKPAEVRERLENETAIKEGFSFYDLFDSLPDQYFIGYITDSTSI